MRIYLTVKKMKSNSRKMESTITEESLQKLLGDSDDVSECESYADDSTDDRKTVTHSFMKKKIWSDTFVYIENEHFEAHRSVLCCFSRFFKKLLSNTDHRKKYIKVKLMNIQPESFEALLNFMYTGNIQLTCHTTPELLSAAKKLQINDALKRIYQILRKINEVDKLFYVYVASKQYGIQKKWLFAYQTILNNFEKSVLSPEFLNLELDEVCEILSGDTIAARSEVVVFMAALRWIQHDYLEREKFAIRIMACVRFSLMKLQEILACYHPPILQDIVSIPDIRGMLLTATCYLAAESIGKQFMFKQFSSLPRIYTVEGKLDLWTN